MPTPPPAAKRDQRRSKADHRVAWIMDLQTAATVFAHGYDLVSADAHHPFIAAQLHALAPRCARSADPHAPAALTQRAVMTRLARARGHAADP